MKFHKGKQLFGIQNFGFNIKSYLCNMQLKNANQIPIYYISDRLNGDIVSLQQASESIHLPVTDYAHRDDFYIFMFVEKGIIKVSIDFEEYELKGGSIHCILPGQVHSLINYVEANSWVLAVDRMLVNDKYKEVFEKVSFIKNRVELDKDTISDLKCCISILSRRLKLEKQSIEQNIIEGLLSSYIGIFAKTYQKELPVLMDKHLATITFQFKSLLSSNYRLLKSPSQYAAKLNVSPVYLNEAVKKTTGLTVSKCIQNENILQAQRLLFHTDMSIKEVALEIGYEDWAYFTRLFTKRTSLSPTQFRNKIF